MKLPEINGHIARMKKDELKTKLRELKLNDLGVKDVMVKRLVYVKNPCEI